jgi:hypothetical protein
VLVADAADEQIRKSIREIGFRMIECNQNWRDAIVSWRCPWCKQGDAAWASEVWRHGAQCIQPRCGKMIFVNRYELAFMILAAKK